MLHILRILVALALLVPVGGRCDDPRPRALPAGEGPFLSRVAVPAEHASGEGPSLRRAGTEVYVDLPCDVFLPGKADPRDWMASATIARVTYDGFTYQYGYDPFAQSYDLLVSGLAHSSGIVIQETVGVLAAEIPPVLEAGQIERVEAWFLVASHNLFPDEFVGITALEGPVAPSSSLDASDMQRLYDDARGFTGGVYALEHFGVGPHAIDLGPAAVADLSERIADEGWFGVGFGADGWDLSGSIGQLVEWRVAGGGGLPAGNRPFFRVFYNAPPASFDLTGPEPAAVVSHPSPTLSWSPAIDPNGDVPVTYTVRLGTDPTLQSAVEFSAGTATQATPPFPLGEAIYTWEVEAADPKGASTTSSRRSFTVAFGTPVPSPSAAGALSAAPNPFNPRTSLRFTLEVAQSVTLDLIDSRGRRVRRLHGGPLPAGNHQLQWDGRDDSGGRCASGSYLARLQRFDREERTRITLVR